MIFDEPILVVNPSSLFVHFGLTNGSQEGIRILSYGEAWYVSYGTEAILNLLPMCVTLNMSSPPLVEPFVASNCDASSSMGIIASSNVPLYLSYFADVISDRAKIPNYVQELALEFALKEGSTGKR